MGVDETLSNPCVAPCKAELCMGKQSFVCKAKQSNAWGLHSPLQTVGDAYKAPLCTQRKEGEYKAGTKRSFVSFVRRCLQSSAL